MLHVFGPVPSRRLGRSLGVDPIALKTCNWNCVYCQLGRSTSLARERKEYVPTEDVLRDVEGAVRECAPGDVDWITFGGSGEPTLHTGLGRMIRAVKEMTDIPVAVLTNGSLLYLPEVQVDLMTADAVLPTLDAGTEELYQRTNRPRPELIFDRLVNGLVAFRRVYGGKLWVEVMLVKGLNDGDDALADLAALLDRIRPHEVHITVPSRAPAESWVSPPDDDRLARAAAILGPRARIMGATAATLDLADHADVEKSVVEILTRHPMSADDLAQAFGDRNAGLVEEALGRLRETGRVEEVMRLGRKFWVPTGARYAWNGVAVTPPPVPPGGTPPR
jgi:wyosine [tRNA(Phe)-imidazoG37] synthetase (radical SAM superfamily)